MKTIKMKLLFTFISILVLSNLGITQTQIGNDLVGFIPDDDFGYSVSVSDDGQRVAIGAPGDILDQEAGYIKVYEKNGSDWTQLGSTIVALAPFNNAGGRVRISGDGQRLILGALYNNNKIMSGSVIVYEFINNDWLQLGQPLGSIDELMTVGQQVAISQNGNIIAFTTTDVTSISEVTGRVDVYEWAGNSWRKKGNTFNPTETFDLYGYSIDLSDDGARLAIGASNGISSITNSPAGFAQVFEFDSGQWKQLGSNIEGKYSPGTFGSDVSLSGNGNRIIVHGAGSVNGIVLTGTVRAFDFDGSTWKLVGNELIGGERFDRFGEGIRLSKDGLCFVYGAYSDGDNKGCSALYRLSAGMWERQGEKVCGDIERDQFGYAVDLSADGMTVVTGARVNEENEIKSGNYEVIKNPEKMKKWKVKARRMIRKIPKDIFYGKYFEK